MQTTNLPWWQQVTALVSLSASGAVTGFTLAPNAAAGVTPAPSTQIRLLATPQASTDRTDTGQAGTHQASTDRTGTHQASTDQASTDQVGSDHAGQTAAGKDTAHRAADQAPRPPEPARAVGPARGAAHSAGGSGASAATLSSADAQLAQDDSALRPAIVNVANYYLRMAANKTPAEMEAIIWQHDSLDGVDHGPSCAAFASLTLELGAQAAGQQSWVTGGGSYPWPLHEWADVRVDPNPASPGIMSVKQDAQAHGRWHPLGDGYQPQPGDWVLFDGHVEVVTQYTGGVLHTIGGDSLPNFSVNAHEYGGSLAAQGIEGFVNNGELTGSAGAGGQPQTQHQQAEQQQAEHRQATSTSPGLADVPGSTGPGAASGGTAAADPAASGRALSARGLTTSASHAPAGYHIHHVRPHGRPGPASLQSGAGVHELSQSSVPGTGPTAQSATLDASTHGTAAVPGLSTATHPSAGSPTALTTPYSRHLPALPATSGPDAATRQAFIAKIVPGAIDTQRQYGIPAAVTIAQAIDESGWGQSGLAVNDHNLFGIKGSGPAGRDWQVTQEFENGQSVTRNASFRVYNNVAESINDHGKLLATSGYYRQAMAEQHSPDGFASALTGVYATDPSYGAKLISLMHQYDLYRYDLSSVPSTTSTQTPAKQTPGGASIPGIHEGGSKAGRGSEAPAGRTTPAPPTPSPSRGSTTPPRVPSPPRTPPPRVPSPPRTPPPRVPSPPRTTPPTPAPPHGSSTSPPPRGPSHPRTTAPRTVTPPETVTMPGLVAAPGSAAAPGSMTPLGTAAAHQPTALPGTGTATGTGLESGAAAGTGTAVRMPRVSGPGNAAWTQTGSHTKTGSRTAHGLTPDPGPASTSGPTTQASPRTAGSVTATKHRSLAPMAEIPGTTTTTAPTAKPDGLFGGLHRSASQPGATLGGQHRSASQPGASKPDHPGASAQSSAATRLSAQTASAKPISAQLTAETVPVAKPSTQAGQSARDHGSKPRDAAARAKRSPLIQYHHEMPNGVRTAFVATARGPLLRAEPLYRDVASHSGIRWELLAACDWMQCEARQSHSPVHGEKLGIVNPDGTSYRTKSAALEQCADDLIELAGAVYGIDLLGRGFLSVRELANVFAAFRWGGLLKQHRTSAMEFPYSVAGLTPDRMNMRWPNIAEPHAPDKPGARFRRPFGAVPVVLNLHYPVTA